MFINSNIKYLRQLKRLSQENFAKHIGLNRGNVASYEQSTMPPLDVLLNISNWYNISTDALIKVDLENSLSFSSNQPIEACVSQAELLERLCTFVSYLEENEKQIAKLMQISLSELQAYLNASQPIDLGLLLKLAQQFSWLSMEWLIRGEGNAWH